MKQVLCMAFSVKKILAHGVLYIALTLLGLTSVASASAYCQGKLALIGGVYCDLLPVGGGSALCLLWGKDINANGAIEGGTSDVCSIMDPRNDFYEISCAKACSLANDCKKLQCPGSLSSQENDALFNIRDYNF